MRRVFFCRYGHSICRTLRHRDTYGDGNITLDRTTCPTLHLAVVTRAIWHFRAEGIKYPDFVGLTDVTKGLGKHTSFGACPGGINRPDVRRPMKKSYEGAEVEKHGYDARGSGSKSVSLSIA